MGYNDIYDEYQSKYEVSNRLKFKALLDMFKEMTGLNIDCLMRAYKIDSKDPAKEYCFFKWYLFNYKQALIPLFYELLESFGFDMFSEVIEAMKTLGTLWRIDSGAIDYVKISPYIDGVTEDNKGLVTIHSVELGDFSFYPSRLYLKNNKEAIYYINEFITSCFCHRISWKLTKAFDNCQLITSLLPSYFEGTHYHTVIRDSDGLIVDSAMEAIYTDEVRDMLFKADDVIVTDKKDLENRLERAILEEDEESKSVDFPEAMLLALNEQSRGLR